MRFAYILVNTTFGYERIDCIHSGRGAAERAAEESTARGIRKIRVLTTTALKLRAGAKLPARYRTKG